jgi:hypothetical protein
MAKINRKQLLLELKVVEPILVKEAERVLRENYFDPAVEEMKREFLSHPVTQEIKNGVGSENLSNTLGGGSKKDLFSFIGFNQGDDPILPILEKLDSKNESGPKLKYVRGSQKQNLEFVFKVESPDKEAIKRDTSVPWAEGLSWADRIEKGIPGLGYFLNRKDKVGSRSGGGIQIDNKLRDKKFRPVSYLSTIFKNFLKNITK